MKIKRNMLVNIRIHSAMIAELCPRLLVPLEEPLADDERVDQTAALRDKLHGPQQKQTKQQKPQTLARPLRPTDGTY